MNFRESTIALAHVTKLVAAGFTAALTLVALDQVVHHDLERLTLYYLGFACAVFVISAVAHDRRDGRVRGSLSGAKDVESLRAHLMSHPVLEHNSADLEFMSRGFWAFGALDLHALVRAEQERRERRAHERLTLAFALFAFVFAMMIIFRVEVLPLRDQDDQCDEEECDDMKALADPLVRRRFVVQEFEHFAPPRNHVGVPELHERT